MYSRSILGVSWVSSMFIWGTTTLDNRMCINGLYRSSQELCKHCLKNSAICKKKLRCWSILRIVFNVIRLSIKGSSSTWASERHLSHCSVGMRRLPKFIKVCDRLRKHTESTWKHQNLWTFRDLRSEGGWCPRCPRCPRPWEAGSLLPRSNVKSLKVEMSTTEYTSMLKHVLPQGLEAAVWYLWRLIIHISFQVSRRWWSQWQDACQVCPLDFAIANLELQRYAFAAQKIHARKKCNFHSLAPWSAMRVAILVSNWELSCFQMTSPIEVSGCQACLLCRPWTVTPGQVEKCWKSGKLAPSNFRAVAL